MPPKPKHTREEIVAAGVEIVREKGMEALSSRELGAKLGTTARPIFTAFENMEELRGEIVHQIVCLFDEYGRDFAGSLSGFERVGFMVATFAMEEPNLFKALFLHGTKTLHTVREHFTNTRSIVSICFGDIQGEYALTEEQTRYLFEQFWIYTFGISALCEMNIYHFEKQELIDRLNAQVSATLHLLKK